MTLDKEVHLRPFGNDGAFLMPALAMESGTRQLAARGAGVTLLSGGAGLAIQIISTVALARLLSPADFGVVTMVTTFSLLLVSVGQIGFPEAVVQREGMNHQLASNLFWINVGAGVLLTLVFAASGTLLARFYHDTRVEEVALGISITIVLTSTSVLHLALLKRAMRFSVVSANDIVARLVSVLVSVLLGLAGWRYWALVAGAIALPLSQSIGAFYYCRWVPGLPRRNVEGTGDTLRFTFHTYGRFGLNYVTGNTDNLLIARSFNAHSLGFYKKAYDLFALCASQFVNSLTLVFVSALRQVKGDSDEYRKWFLSALTVMTFFGMGLAASLTLIGRDLIRVLLGPGWEESGRIFTFFGPGIGAMMVYYTHGWIHLSLGRADRWLRWGFIEFTVTVLLFLVGLPWGPVGVAVAWTTAFWLLMVPSIWYAGRPVGLKVGTLLGVIWKYIIASVSAGLMTHWLAGRFDSFNNLPGAAGAAVRVVANTLTVAAIYLGAVAVLHRSFEPLRMMADLLREMMPWHALAEKPYLATESSRGEQPRNYEQSRLDLPSESAGMPLVSILIPAYNAEKWIAETIGSALSQDWNPKEIVIVDDGSTDRTLEIARRFESRFVRVFRQTKQGASAARNTAFSLCHGDYIQWLDADDLLAPDKVSKQMEPVLQGLGKRTVLSCPWGQFWYQRHRGRFVPSGLWCDLSPAEFLLRKMEQNTFMQTSTWLVSRELTEAAGPWSTSLTVDDDGEYFCRILLASNGIKFVPDAKVYYRYSGMSGLNYIGLSDKKMVSSWCSMQLHIGYLLSLENSQRSRAACCKYLQTNLIHFYGARPDIAQEMRQKAEALGKRLEPPRLSWKFSWIRMVAGWRYAIGAQLFMPHLKWIMVGFWDRVLSQIKPPKTLPATGLAQQDRTFQPVGRDGMDTR